MQFRSESGSTLQGIPLPVPGAAYRNDLTQITHEMIWSVDLSYRLARSTMPSPQRCWRGMR